jgi:Bacterial PH domain
MAASVSADSGGLVGRCQGARWRRVTRGLMAIGFGLLFVGSEGPKSHSLGSWLLAIFITVAIIAAFDVWFSRRMGLTIDEQGITLRYAFHRKRVSWADVQDFEWKRWNSPRSDWIWITLSSGRAIRIPTIQRTPGGQIRSGAAYRLLASENLRLDGGVESDAMATLRQARAAMRSQQGNSESSAAAPSASSTVPPI